MKRMHLIVVTLVLGLALCGLMAVRQARRTALTAPPASDLPAISSKQSQPMDTWQAAIKADMRTDYTGDATAKKRLMEKLHQEELRQRPQEGRN